MVMKKELIAELYKCADGFAEELTRHNVIAKNLKSKTAICKEHSKNGFTVRKILKERVV